MEAPSRTRTHTRTVVKNDTHPLLTGTGQQRQLRRLQRPPPKLKQSTRTMAAMMKPQSDSAARVRPCFDRHPTTGTSAKTSPHSPLLL